MAALSPNDTLIVKARMRGVALDDLSDQELDAALTGIIFNISVICGCQLPVNENHVNALEKEFSIFLKDFGYTMLTPEEILTAFRMNAAGLLDEKIEVYGSVFNIDYAGKVIRQYRDKRFHVDLRLGHMYVQKERDEEIEKLDNERRKNVQSQYEKYLSDSEDVDLKDCYMQLVQDDAFADHNVYLRFTDRSELFMESRSKYAYLNPTAALTSYGDYMDVAFAAQQLAVKYLFYNLMKYGVKEIYNEQFQLTKSHFIIPEGTVLPKENIEIIKEEDINKIPF